MPLVLKTFEQMKLRNKWRSNDHLDRDLNRLQHGLSVLRDRDLNRHRLLDRIRKLEHLGAGGRRANCHLLPAWLDKQKLYKMLKIFSYAELSIKKINMTLTVKFKKCMSR